MYKLCYGTNLKLFDKAPNTQDQSESSSMNALHLACRQENGDPEILKWLISVGVDVNKRTENVEFECTPIGTLMEWADFNEKNIERVNVLLDAGADINEAANHAIIREKFDFLKYYVSKGVRSHP